MRLFGNALQNLYAALSVTAPPGYAALTLAASAGQNALAVTGTSAFYGNVGVISAASGQAFSVNNNANTLQYMYVSSAGGVLIANPGTNYGLNVTGGASASAIFAQAGTGQSAITASGIAGSYAVTVTGSGVTGSSDGLVVNAGTNTTDYCFSAANQAGNTNYLLVRGDGSVSVGGSTSNGFGTLSVLKSLTAGTVSTAAQHTLLSSTATLPGSGAFGSNAYLLVGGSGGNYLAFGQNPSGDQYAQWIQSGFSSASPTYYDIALNPVGGGVTIGAPTGGGQGNGTLNVSGGLYINGVAVTTGSGITSGTFTGTLTGCTTSPTGTFTYQIIGGKIAVISFQAGVALTGSSNSTGCTITGLPGSLTPAYNQNGGYATVENAGGYVQGSCSIAAGQTTLILYNGPAGGTTFSNSGTKGLAGLNFVYSLV